MVALVRSAKVLLILLLVVFAVSLAIAIANPETGTVEKVVLAAMFGGCVFLAARVTKVAGLLSSSLRSR